MAGRLAYLLVPCLLAAGGCGGEERRRPLAPVRLTVDAPLDPATVDVVSTEVRGQVWPADARVLVAGEEAGRDGGAFAASVELQAGINVVDVIAAAPRRRAAMAAVRITFRAPVEVPDLAGRPPEEAERELEALGLRARIDRGGGLLDELLPGSLGVCRTEPPAGEEARAGSTVVVRVANVC